jgi:hypothetical protein
MRRNPLVYRLQLVSIRETNVNVGVLEPETRVNVGGDFVVRLDNVFDIGIDKVVEGVDVLFHQPFDLEKGWEKEPFVLEKVRLFRFGWYGCISTYLDRLDRVGQPQALPDGLIEEVPFTIFLIAVSDHPRRCPMK